MKTKEKRSGAVFLQLIPAVASMAGHMNFILFCLFCVFALVGCKPTK